MANDNIPQDNDLEDDLIKMTKKELLQRLWEIVEKLRMDNENVSKMIKEEQARLGKLLIEQEIQRSNAEISKEFHEVRCKDKEDNNEINN